MPKNHRLQSHKEIERVFRRGRRRDNVLFRLMALNNAAGYLRLALVAPRAAEKRAVARNRMRRRAREWVRTHPDVLRIGLDAAIIFKKQAAQAPRAVFYKELENVFSALPELGVRD